MLYKIFAVLTAMKYVMSVPPRWITPTDGATFNLDALFNTACDRVTVIYASSGNGGTVSYSVFSQSPAGGFDTDLDINTGEDILKCNLATIKALTATIFSVTLRASDSRVNADRTITINVTGLSPPNANAPVFSGTPYNLKVCRDKINCLDDISLPYVLFRLIVTDADNNTVTISLSGADPALFTTENHTIKVKGSLVSLSSPYELKVIATDNGIPSKISSATVTLTLGYAPKFTDPSNSSDVIYLRETSIGGDELIKFQASDTDTPIAKHVFSMDNSPTETKTLFEIVGDILKVKSVVPNGTFDYEKPNAVLQYNISLMVSDGTFSSVLNTQIVLEDFNDNPPVFINTPYTKSILEATTPGSSVLQVSATDADKTSPNNAVTFTLSGSNDFTIKNISGVISVSAGVTLNYDTTPSYSLTVTAIDGGVIDDLTATALVTLKILTKPTFDNLALARSVTVDENVAIGTSVFALKVTDRDNSGPLSYLIKTESVSGAFVLNGSVLQTAKAIDKETLSSYSISFNVTDGTYTLESALLTININDVNEKPTISVPNSPVKLLKPTVAGTQVFNVSASDPDMSAPNNVITFSLSGSGSSDFSIMNSGVVLVASGVTLDYTRQPSYQLVITAMDGGTPSLSSSSNVTVSILTMPNKSCDVEELYHYTWNYTRGGVQVNQSCPNTHKGQVTRECQVSGIWKPPYYNCTLKSLEDIKANLTQGNINPSEALINLVNGLPVNVNGSDKTNTTLYIGDLIIIMEILELVTYNISNTSVQETEDFLTIASIVVDHEKNGDEWRSRVENVGKGAEEFLSVVDKFTAKATESLQNNNQSSLNITRQNLVLQYAKIEPSNPDSIVFPTALENDLKWNTTPTSSVFLNYTAFYDQGVTAYSVVLYRNLSQSVPSTLSERPNNKDVFVNSQVLSIQMLPKAPNPLNPNIELTLRGFQNMDKAEKHCSFWKLNETSNYSNFGTWSTDGCREIFSNSTHVQCACSHLTNFALLISPFVPPKEHVKILGVISIVGISISMASLLITIGIHALHWRLVKRDNSIMLVSLCIVLLVGNALFLGGVNRTDNAVGCQIIAAVLHYLFLVAFFLLLSEGVKMFIKIVFIFNKTSYLVHMLAVSFVVPLIIVGISLGVTKLEGYGDDKFCWLSRENGLFWAFAGPSGLVILMNFIVIVLLTKTMCRRRPGVEKSIIQKAKLTAIKLMVIVPILGVSWISGILSVDEDSLWLQYVFCIFNSLQGVAILIFHVIRNTKLQKAIQAQRARKKSLEDFTSSSKGSNFQLKKKIMARLGKKQSSSTTSLASNTSAINMTDDKKSPYLNQKNTPERTTDIDNNKIDDLNLKDDYNSGYSTIRGTSELKTFRREVPETVSHTEFTSTENLIDIEVKPNTKKYNIDKTMSETEYTYETQYCLDESTVYDDNIPNDE